MIRANRFARLALRIAHATKVDTMIIFNNDGLKLRSDQMRFDEWWKSVATIPAFIITKRYDLVCAELSAPVIIKTVRR